MQKLYVLLLLTISTFFCSIKSDAQVTTSGISGFVRNPKGEILPGATVTAIHVPSGTKYVTMSKKNGNFSIPNTRIGGPYKITAEYVGYSPQVLDNINLSLGETYSTDLIMNEKNTVLNAVTVSAQRRNAALQKTGASTILGPRQIATLPTFSRSLSDFTRLTPQANGNNFAGRDGRLNNLQIDGANLNNNFGLNNDPQPGGGSNPISIDAYDEISVNIAPYDVRQSGFTGAGINVLTKSGTNTFHGTAYGFYRDQSFNGKKINDSVLTQTPQKSQVEGVSFGGPIIKNKLFFFLNAEWENNSKPSANLFQPGANSASPVDSLNKFRDYLKSAYNYDAGEYKDLPNFVVKNRKLLGKINWNINNVHKLSLKYSDFSGSDQSLVNGTSVPNSGAGGYSIRGFAGTRSSLPNNRNSGQSIAFSNSNYGTNHVVKSATLELNSNFSSKFSNQLLLGYTHIQDTRFTPGGIIFPTIEIFNADGTVPNVTKGFNYMSAGTDPFTRNNDVINNIYNFTDNFTYYAGRHTLTAGATYEYQKVGNAFMGGSESYYIYNNLNDFVTNQSPAFFSYTYSLIPGKPKVFSADLKLGQLGGYIQDEFNVNSNFKLTYGVRGDIPTYLKNPLENPAISALSFPDKDGTYTNFNTGKWPKAKLLLSPRAGFRWKIPEENLTIRGGTGVFTGKIPFVFLTNMPSNSGVYQIGGVINTPAALADIKFNPNPDFYVGKFPATAPSTAPGSFVLIDRNFKFPQVFRTNLGIDKSLGNGFLATIDILYTKDINAVKMRNANLKDPTAILSGTDNRPYFPASTLPADKFVYPNLAGVGRGGTAIVLENTKKGYSFSSTAQLSKSFSKGFYGSLAYTYTLATEISSNPGSQATSAWQAIVNRGTPNSEELYNSAYSVPNRVVGTLSYRFEYLKHLATTVSLFYEGANQFRYNFVTGGDLNNDGNASSDLMFIYAKGSDVNFQTVKNADGSTKYSIPQQQAAYDQLIQSSSYLKRHAGQYAERNSALAPWFNRLDARILQDIFINTGSVKNTLQFSVDIVNLPNLISSNLGVRSTTTLANPLSFKSIDAAGNPVYTINTYTLNKVEYLPTKPFQTSYSNNNTWGIQLGLRYIF